MRMILALLMIHVNPPSILQGYALFYDSSAEDHNPGLDCNAFSCIHQADFKIKRRRLGSWYNTIGALGLRDSFQVSYLAWTSNNTMTWEDWHRTLDAVRDKMVKIDYGFDHRIRDPGIKQVGHRIRVSESRIRTMIVRRFDIWRKGT